MLRYREDRRTLFAVASYFALLTALWCGTTSVGVMGWYGFTAWLALAWSSLTGAIITHNLVHVPVFVNPRLNQLFQIVVTLTYGHPVSSFVPGHNLSHHRYTQTRKDYMRSSKVNFRWNLMNVLLFKPSVVGAVLRSDIAYTAKQYRKGSPFFKRVVSEFGTLLIVTAWLFWLCPRKAFVYWILPHVWAQYGIVTINFLQHDGCEPGNGINSARNFTGGLLNLLLFNNGFHTIHHMQPHLHWSILPAMHKKLVEPTIDPRLNEPNFLLYFMQTFIYPGKRLDFKGRPVVITPEMVQDIPWMSVDDE
jgi:fatty acid desaturase